MLAFYFDEHVPRAIAVGLKLRGADVLTAQQDGSEGASDLDLLRRATALGRVLVSFDRDLLREARLALERGDSFSGLVSAHPLAVSVGECIRDLDVVAQVMEPAEMKDLVVYLPL